MELRITIDTGNDAFCDGNEESEISCILHRFGEKIIREGLHQEAMPLLDHNGNEVGQAVYR